MRYCVATLLGTLFVACTAFAAAPTMTVHEWGTFTNLQDESGNSIAGINSDDEPLPPFAHNLKWEWSVGNASDQRSNTSLLIKGFPRAHPDVTMRLETPVLYFHPETPDWNQPLYVHVEFHGGYLTQFYPEAQATKVENHISAGTVSRLDWTNLSIGGDHPGPKTDSPVWLAPRHVAAADVTTPKGESERYLFYRGVGHIDAPLRVARTDSTIQIRPQLDPAFGQSTKLHIPQIWYCQFRDDGTCAFREIEPLSISPSPRRTAMGPFANEVQGGPALAQTDANFAPSDFSSDQLTELKSQMREALISQGLFADEATALLNTWDVSYFKSAGTRLFYIVPREWTERYPPLQVYTGLNLSCAVAVGPPPPKININRVMVGRIDLVTPEQRQLLRDMSGHPSAAANDPAVWHEYVLLGRFRNALVLDELKRHPTDGLQSFIRVHDLAAAQ
jgi:hypothetical protein